jgi:hypothetical protein
VGNSVNLIGFGEQISNFFLFRNLKGFGVATFNAQHFCGKPTRFTGSAAITVLPHRDDDTTFLCEVQDYPFRRFIKKVSILTDLSLADPEDSCVLYAR